MPKARTYKPAATEAFRVLCELKGKDQWHRSWKTWLKEVRQSLRAGADPNIEVDTGCCLGGVPQTHPLVALFYNRADPMDEALDFDWNALLEAVLKAGLKPSGVPFPLLSYLAGDGGGELVGRLLEAGVPVPSYATATREEKESNLAHALAVMRGLGFESCWKAFLGSPHCNEWLTQRTKDGETVLHLFFESTSPFSFGKWEALPWWLPATVAHGVDIDAKTNGGFTALMVCANPQALLDMGADIHQKNAHGETALHQAVAKNNAKTVSDLLGRGAAPDERTVEGETPLWWLATYDRLNLSPRQEEDPRGSRCRSIARSLLAAGADIHQKSNSGRSPYQRIMERGFGAEIKEIMAETMREKLEAELEDRGQPPPSRPRL